MATVVGDINSHVRSGFATFAVTVVMILLFQSSPHAGSTDSNVVHNGVTGTSASSLRVPGLPSFKSFDATPPVVASAAFAPAVIPVVHPQISASLDSGEAPSWPSDAILWSVDGRPLNRLSLDALWAWSPADSATIIVSGDTLRDSAPYICDDDYGVGQKHGCRFASSALRSPARIYAKLRRHYPEARNLAAQAGVKHIFLHGGGDEPVNEEQTNVSLVCTSQTARHQQLIAPLCVALPPLLPHTLNYLRISLLIQIC